MQRFRRGGTAAAGDGVAARRGRRRVPARLTTTLAAASLAAALAMPLGTALAAPASAAAPPPAPGVTPGAVASDLSHQYLSYTAADGSVWAENVANGKTTPTAIGGRLVSAPSPAIPGIYLAVFGQGTDNQLWENGCNLNLSYGCGGWLPLGGQITSKPGAVSPGSASYSVYARGTDGAVWARDFTNYSGLGPWHSLGGQVLAGTGPTAAYLNGSTYVMVVGTDHQLWIQQVGVTGFVPAGGQTNASPALAALPATSSQPAALVGFALGTNGDAYYHRFNSASPGWHWMNGTFTSGMAASEAVQKSTPATNTCALGMDGRIYEMTAFWNAYPPGLTVWAPVTG